MSAAACSHLDWIRQPAKEGAIIHKEECTQCFLSDSSPSGLDVCLTCFNGGCTGSESLHHSARHAQLGHPLVVNIRKIAVEKDKEKEKEEGDAEMKDEASERATKVTKLGIGVAGGVDLPSLDTEFRYETQARCLHCNCDLDPAQHPQLADCIDAVLKAHSSTRPKEIGWEDELQENCPHCVALDEEQKKIANPPQLGERNLSTCTSCDVKSDMWLCLTCGALGCSRKQMTGAGTWSDGNGHAVAHSESTGHPLVLKVGTLTAEGRGDVWCYHCNNSVLDKQLAAHVATFGIHVSSTTHATVASTADLNLDLNLNMNWSLVFEEDGKEAELAFGPGQTGLTNLGNSCYMASVLQVLFAIPDFHARYFEQAEAHLTSCRSARPADCFQCQISKLAIGLLSGRHDPQPTEEEMKQIIKDREERDRRNKAIREGTASEADKAEVDSKKRKKPLQRGIAPRMFKTLVAGKHPEFSSARQQDSFEFVHFLLDYLKQKEHALRSGFDPYKPFQFMLEDRLQCSQCQKVRYTQQKSSELSLPIPLPEPLPPKEQPEAAPRADGKPAPPPRKEYPPVSFRSCVDAWAQPQSVESWNCPSCSSAVTATKASRLQTFPPILMVHMRRFVYEGWVPEKLDIEVQLTGEDKEATEARIQLDELRAKGLQEGEVELPAGDNSGSGASQPQPDPAIVSGLEAMGFGSNACKRAALAVNNASTDEAANWLFAHMDDADLNDPLPEPSSAAGASGAGGNEPPAEAVSNLEMMGFETARCKYALKQCDHNVERAVEWLFSHADEPLPDEAPPAAAADASSSADVSMSDMAPAGYELFAFITHLGKSTGSGHYVAHVKKAHGRWLLFNDHKVSFVSKPMKAAAYAYLYFFRRIQQ